MTRQGDVPGAGTAVRRRKSGSDLEVRWFIVGVFLLLVAIGFAAWGFSLGSDLREDQRRILLFVLSLAAGVGAGAFAGSISVKARGLVPGVVVSAAGGFAAWVITFYSLFPQQQVLPIPPPTVVERFHNLKAKVKQRSERNVEICVRAVDQQTQSIAFNLVTPGGSWNCTWASPGLFTICDGTGFHSVRVSNLNAEAQTATFELVWSEGECSVNSPGYIGAASCTQVMTEC
jgi:hypothetical protein